jgi:hypothetical protein
MRKSRSSSSNPSGGSPRPCRSPDPGAIGAHLVGKADAPALLVEVEQHARPLGPSAPAPRELGAAVAFELPTTSPVKQAECSRASTGRRAVGAADLDRVVLLGRRPRGGRCAPPGLGQFAMGTRAETTSCSGDARRAPGRPHRRRPASAPCGGEAAGRPGQGTTTAAGRSRADFASRMAARCSVASPSRSLRKGPFSGEARSSAGSATPHPAGGPRRPAGQGARGRRRRRAPSASARRAVMASTGARRAEASARRSGVSASAADERPAPRGRRTASTTGTPMRRSARARARRSTVVGSRSRQGDDAVMLLLKTRRLARRTESETFAASATRPREPVATNLETVE